MKRILIVSRDIERVQDGGTMVSKRNERILQQAGFVTERFIIPVPSMTTRLRNLLLRESYGETPALKKAFRKKLKENFDYVFFDSSIYGGFLEIAARMGHKTVCFYHNVEANYYSQKARQTADFRDRLMVPYIRLNELISTNLAKGIITLNERDSKELGEIYGRQADIVMPTSWPERDLDTLYSNSQSGDEPYVLFVGTNFFANYEGLDRYIRHIVPKLKVKTLVVGNINEAFKNRTDIPENVEFLGRVNSLEPYYLNASAVVAPIFTGSGLKTKTAEALSYGKKVIGFPEAFEGIEHEGFPDACVTAETDKDFIEAINALDLNQKLNPSASELFRARLTDDVQVPKIIHLLSKI